MGTLGKALEEMLPLLCLSGEEQYFLSFFSFFYVSELFHSISFRGLFHTEETLGQMHGTVPEIRGRVRVWSPRIQQLWRMGWVLEGPCVEYMTLPRGRWKPLKDPVGSSAFG